MAALDTVEWEACALEPVRDREAEQYLRRTYGVFVPPAVRYFIDVPWLMRAGGALGLESVPLVHISEELAQMIALVVSQDNSCRYCYTATRSVMRILGFPETRIRRLEEDFLSADLAPADRAALEFTRRVSRAAPLAGAGEAAALLQAGMSPEGVKEVAFHAADNVFFNRLSTLPALPPTEVEFADRWIVRLLRPLLARHMRSRRMREAPRLTAAEREGPFAALINALDGLPGASRLRGVVNDAWSSVTLPRRTKALVFAVVARGLGCDLSEFEARRLLESEGMDAGAIDRALAHLSGPDLDERDSAAASLARESIWYRPAHIQRQVRALRALYGTEQLIELIGIASLANMLCRIGVASVVPAQSH